MALVTSAPSSSRIVETFPIYTRAAKSTEKQERPRLESYVRIPDTIFARSTLLAAFAGADKGEKCTSKDGA